MRNHQFFSQTTAVSPQMALFAGCRGKSHRGKGIWSQGAGILSPGKTKTPAAQIGPRPRLGDMDIHNGSLPNKNPHVHMNTRIGFALSQKAPATNAGAKPSTKPPNTVCAPGGTWGLAPKSQRPEKRPKWGFCIESRNILIFLMVFAFGKPILTINKGKHRKRLELKACFKKTREGRLYAPLKRFLSHRTIAFLFCAANTGLSFASLHQ